MILTGHQPAYLPWLGLFHKITLADVYVFMDNVKYSNSDKFINRNFIKKNDGTKMLLTVPIITHGSDNINISDLKIDNTKNWQRSHLLTIKQFYSKSKYGKEYFPYIEEFYNKEYEYLKDLSFDMLTKFLEILEIKTKVAKASELDINSSKNQYLIDLCKSFNCNGYIFGEQGAGYIDNEAWKKEGISTYIQKYNHPTYEQLHGDFVSHLSIIDLLFNHGPESRNIIMQGNISKEELIKGDSE